MSPVKYFVSIAGGVVLRLVPLSQVKSPNAKGALATESVDSVFIVLLFENNLEKNEGTWLVLLVTSLLVVAGNASLPELSLAGVSILLLFAGCETRSVWPYPLQMINVPHKKAISFSLLIIKRTHFKCYKRIERQHLNAYCILY